MNAKEIKEKLNQLARFHNEARETLPDLEDKDRAEMVQLLDELKASHARLKEDYLALRVKEKAGFRAAMLANDAAIARGEMADPVWSSKKIKPVEFAGFGFNEPKTSLMANLLWAPMSGVFWFFVWFTLFFAILWFFADYVRNNPEMFQVPPSQPSPRGQEHWGINSRAPSQTARETARKAEESHSVQVARQASQCHGPACYHDSATVRSYAATGW